MQASYTVSRLFLAVTLLGILAGLGATGFHFLADRFGEILHVWSLEQSAVTRLPVVLVVPTVGLFLVGILLQRFPESRRGGVREVFEELTLHGGVIPFFRMANVILSGFVLAFGGSVGPEGPMVQMGAVIGCQVAQKLGLSGDLLRTLVRAGAAAGIAAAFRSPAGAVLFTLEVFRARLDQELLAIGGAAAIGYLTRTAILGDAYPFQLAVTQSLPLAGLLVVAPLMGVTGALAGHAFLKLLARAKGWFPRGWPLSVKVGFGGLLVGTIGIWFPQVMSAGYPVILQSLQGQVGFTLFVALLLLKMLATSITFGSGAVGGLFAPTLVMGAMFGGAWGFGVHALFPEAVPQPELLVLLGMIVMFGAIVKGYWSGLLMVADMSGCYHALLLPGIMAGGISYLISWKLHDRSVFDLPLDSERKEAKREASLATTA